MDRCSDVKTEFLSQPIIDLLKLVFLPIIEMSLLFETQMNAAQARHMQSPMLTTSLDELHYVFLVITLEDL